ncbi:uncharacterized protein LOC125777545 [Bactrocera dorsalis]|uniref:Uncharacterized protein LOC125777545 n=1 Tax=Bactrocera dorsalis TaxID=27457 RepID=A0ABM3JH97_BACDO|nr:uncharacterized protein LOC125777545 [Bactrocera dorsalis]
MPIVLEQQPLAVQVNMPYQQHDLKNTWGNFDGTLTMWPGFRDRFSAAIHENRNVSPAFKFSYLKKSLVGGAAQTLGEWQLTDDNYIEAWDRLKQLYDRKYPICREHLRQFNRLPVIGGVPRADELQRMSNVTHEVLRQLRAQGVPVESWDMIIVHTLHELQRETETPTVKQMLDFLDRQAAALDNVTDARYSRSQDVKVVFNNDRNTGGKREREAKGENFHQSRSLGKRSFPCISCDGDHPLWTCDDFIALNLRSREEFVRRNNICQNCFKKGHGAGNCFQKGCSRCPGQTKHNSLLCPIREVVKQALTVKVDEPYRRRKLKGKCEATSTKRRRSAEIGYAHPVQSNIAEDIVAINEEIKIVDMQMSLLDKQEQLSKRRKSLRGIEQNSNDKIEKEINSNVDYSTSFIFNLDSRPALLSTISVRLEANGHVFGPVRALLDCGAQLNFVAASLSDRYQFPILPTSRKMVGIEGKSFGVNRRTVLKIRPWFQSNGYIDEEFWILPKENNWQPILPNADCKLEPASVSFSVPLADPHYWEPGIVQVVLNVKTFAKILIAVHSHNSDGMVYLETHLRMVVCGAHERQSSIETGNSMSYICCTSIEELGELVRRFWQLDQVATFYKRTEEEESVEKIFAETYSRDPTGRFVVSIPLRENIGDIGASREIALRRFMFLEKRFDKNPELKKQYVDFMREYETSGHMELVSRAAKPGDLVYHIPHHCVTKKFRVVFDASCRTDKGISLNEVQMLGEKLQRDLAEIVLRFRRHKIGIIGDIQKMFRQVRIVQSQWDLQRIFWRESTSEPIREYWLKVVTYGMTSSAFNDVRAVIQCARDAAKDFPDASKVIENDLYMDDCASGSRSESEAIKLAKDIDHVLKGGGFEMKKWKSNSKKLIEQMRFGEEEASFMFVDDEKASVLGLKWKINQDQFTFVVKTPELEGVITKRKILGCVAQLYDPNGFISPVTILGKILIQDLWRIGLDWDEPVPEEIGTRFKNYWKDIRLLENFTLDRWIGTDTDGKTEIHGFSDASTTAYGAVIYIRKVQGDGQVKITLLVSKTRVAPMKTVTVPRLELAAAELLSRLLVYVMGAMEFTEVDYTLWTDSQVVLYWIKKIPRNLKTFVANRVSSIQTNTDVKKWRYVNTKDNPADLLSRGMNPSEIVHEDLWVQGPNWLSLAPEKWPQCVFLPNTVGEAEVELRAFAVTDFEDSIHITMRTDRNRVALIEYVDKLQRALDIVAYLFKFISNVKVRLAVRRSKRREKLHLVPDNEHRAKGMKFLLRQEQEQYYNKEITNLEVGRRIPEKSKIESLKPVMMNGLLRVHGRLKNSNLEESMRHPVIVPDGSRLAWLIMDHARSETKHGGVEIMMQFIRQNYWIPRLRSALRKYLHRCVICVRHNHRTEIQMMADLPPDRVRAGKPFLHTGVDYAGPMEIKMIDRDGNQLIKQKVWIAVFVCLKTRAVHLDVVTDLTSVAFIACYERFIARRGRCERIYSDNGTAFVGAAREIRKATEVWYQKEVFQHLSGKGTEWRFMTPAAPHQGGIYEAAVKSMKYHLIRTIGIRVLSFEQLSTLLTQIEAILNSRPLHPLNDDPADFQVLTPGHLLIGEPLVLPLPFAIPEGSAAKGIKQWKERQAIIKAFWVRWQNEYLTTLQERKKWRRESERTQAQSATRNRIRLK